MKIIQKYLVLLVTLVLFGILTIQTIRSDRKSHSNKFTMKSLESACGHFPKQSDILIDNVVWQLLEIPPNVSMKLLNAYLDTRTNQTLVRINSMGSHLNISHDTIFCQLWFDGKVEPVVVKASSYDYLWYVNWWEGSKWH